MNLSLGVAVLPLIQMIITTEVASENQQQQLEDLVPGADPANLPILLVGELCTRSFPVLMAAAPWVARQPLPFPGNRPCHPIPSLTPGLLAGYWVGLGLWVYTHTR